MAAACGTCQICDETLPQREFLLLPEFRTSNGDILRTASNCTQSSHSFCLSCVRNYITIQVSTAACADLKCPGVGCATRLFESDVERLVSREISLTFQKILNSKYGEKRQSTLQGQTVDELIALYHLGIKACPRCGVLVERSSGCNSMWCICGHNFNYAQAPNLVGVSMHILKLGKRTMLPLEDIAALDCTDKDFIYALKVASLVGLDFCAALNLVKKRDAETIAVIRAARAKKHSAEMAAAQRELEQKELRAQRRSAASSVTVDEVPSTASGD